MRSVKNLLGITLLFLFSGIYTLTAQENELKYVWAKSGLIIRDTPSITGNRIGKLAYGDSIRVVEKTEKRYMMKVLEIEEDTRSVLNDFYLKGNWVKIMVEDEEGFVWDGYLSRFPALQFISYTNLELIETWANREFGVTREISSKPILNSDYSKREITFTNGISLNSEITGGGGSEVIVIPGARINEGFLLFDLNDYFNEYAEPGFDQYRILIESDSSIILISEFGEISIKQDGDKLIIFSEGGC